MAKVRVHELAKELGQPSKVVLQKLQDMGEFVRSASSTIEAPVARRLRQEFPAADSAAKKTPGAPTPGSAPKPGAKPAAKKTTAKPAGKPAAKKSAPVKTAAKKVAAKAAPAKAASKKTAAKKG